MAKGFADQKQSSKKKKEKGNIASIDEIQNNLLGYVKEIEDPRVQRSKKHLLKDVLAIAILAVIAGSQGWEDMENYGIAKQEWLSEFLELPHGIPSDDTFRRVFERIDPESLQKCLQKWVQSIMNSIQGEIIPIDGKTLRGSYDRNAGQCALYTVTAWASQQSLVLGQVKVENYSNEITAIPALLELLDITGSIITIDAMGTQTSIIQQICRQKADYIVTLKANHPTLFSQVKQWFTDTQNNGWDGIEHDYYKSVTKGHHRTEKRYVWAIPVAAMGELYQQQQWHGLQTIVVVERIRHLWNKTTHDIQFYLTSLPPNAQFLCHAIRTHWSIENNLHWTLDVTFSEDQCRIRSEYSPQNFALLRRLALNVLHQEKTFKRSLRQKMKQAAMNNNYMMTVLNSFCQADFR
ncbi:transposase [Crocosphaera subtropica ATCC 51142]|uniref:Transposase n=1 Tax=Crocosphaera subtropica (strain ATCC 51142 / BH68) TaxID=43989 RepID=B1WZS9_CROS5|nr:ISAs1-like element ISCysp6 family transposase [Crocosphaera subtropica]ACB52828.1 transposase [Crocosphaera subtropica ATCC 51142]